MVPKFRAWLKDEKKMVNVFLIDTAFQSISPDGNEYNCWFVYQDNRDCVLMQSTGLIDSNGKEIYEGDIVKITQERYNSIYYAEVVWGNSGEDARLGWNFIFKGTSTLNGNILQWNGQLDVNDEVIGNIYENPELLEANNANS